MPDPRKSRWASAAVLLGCAVGCGSAQVEQGPGSATGTVSAAGGIGCGADPDDCVGIVYVYVVEENPLLNPAQRPVALAVIESADLRGGGSAPYSIPEVPPGDWWLAAFLDDDANASRMAPTPDVGDLLPYPFPQITIRSGHATSRDIVLSLRMP